MTIKIISDLHLDKNYPTLISAFKDYLSSTALEADALYILGDFFSVWVGDDAMESWQFAIANMLQQYVATGRSLYIMPGNRDFCYDKQFAKATGCNLIEDPTILQYQGQKILLMHGDSLCSSDIKYQLYRKIIRNKLLIKILLKTPLSFRTNLAASLRAKSKKSNATKSLRILDTCSQTVINCMNKLQVKTLIHGHTHRPKVHDVKLANNTQGKVYVLGDWGEYGWDITLTTDDIKLNKFKLPTN